MALLTGKKIDLREIFNEDEINQFNSATYAFIPNRKKEQHPTTTYPKNKLKSFIYQILKAKLINLNESYLMTALDWLEKDTNDQDKTTDPINNNVSSITSSSTIPTSIDALKKENQELKCIMSWLEEYTTIKLNAIAQTKINSINSCKEISLAQIKEFANGPNYTSDILNNLSDQFITFSEDCVRTIETEAFNIFNLEEQVGAENTLSVVSCYIFTAYGLYSVIKYHIFEKFVQMIRLGYTRNNPYHNDLHAADVTQTCMIFTKKMNIKEAFNLNDLDLCALFISCIVHDYKHPGYTNGLLINLSNPIAIRYNDINTLENYHIAQTFKLIKSNERLNILASLTPEDYKAIRKRMVGMVLATDMVFHFKQFNSLKEKISKFNISQGENREKILEGLERPFAAQQEFLEILVHSSDISNATKTYDIYSYWVDRATEEFFRQGDKERSLNMKISLNCDRMTLTKAEIQASYIEGIVGPYFCCVVEIFPELEFLLENLQRNKMIYKKMKEEEDMKKVMKDHQYLDSDEI